MTLFFLRSKCGGGGGLTGSPGILQNLWESFSADSGGPLTAQDPNDLLNVIGGSGISTALSLVGSPQVATLTISATGSGGLTSAYTMITGGDGGTTMAIGADNLTIIGTGVNVTASNNVGSPQDDVVNLTLDINDLPAGSPSTLLLTSEIAADRSASGTTEKFTVQDIVDLVPPPLPDQDVFETLQGDTGSVTAATPTDTLAVVGGAGISTNVSVVGSPGVATATITNTAPAPTGLSTTVINGQTFLTLVDQTRLGGSPQTPKILSVAEQALVWAENGLSNLDWVRIGNSNDASSGYIADFDGTVVYATAHCENTGTNAKDIVLYINDASVATLGTLSGGNDATFINNTANIDFSQGDRIQLRALNVAGSPSGGTGPIQDTVIKLTLKWRG